MSVTTAPPPTQLPPTFGCDTADEWRPYNGFCFQYQEFYDDFGLAQTRCKNLGAELASIRDANENGFVAAMANEGREEGRKGRGGEETRGGKGMEKRKGEVEREEGREERGKGRVARGG